MTMLAHGTETLGLARAWSIVAVVQCAAGHVRAAPALDLSLNRLTSRMRRSADPLMPRVAGRRAVVPAVVAVPAVVVVIVQPVLDHHPVERHA